MAGIFWMSTKGVCLTLVDVCAPLSTWFWLLVFPKNVRLNRRGNGAIRITCFLMHVKCMDELRFLWVMASRIWTSCDSQSSLSAAPAPLAPVCLCVFIDPLSWICPVTASANKKEKNECAEAQKEPKCPTNIIRALCCNLWSWKMERNMNLTALGVDSVY